MLFDTLVPLLPDEFAWIFGIGFIIGMSIVFTVIFEGDEVQFLGWCLLWSAFAIFGNLVPFYVFVLFLIAYSTMLYFKAKRGGS